MLQNFLDTPTFFVGEVTDFEGDGGRGRTWEAETAFGLSSIVLILSDNGYVGMTHNGRLIITTGSCACHSNLTPSDLCDLFL